MIGPGLAVSAQRGIQFGDQFGRMPMNFRPGRDDRGPTGCGGQRREPVVVGSPTCGIVVRIAPETLKEHAAVRPREVDEVSLPERSDWVLAARRFDVMVSKQASRINFEH